MTAHKRKIMKKKLTAVCLLLLFILCLTACGSNSGKKNKEGLRAYEDGDYQKAAQLFQEAITGDNTNTEYYVNLGMANLEQGAYETAMTNFDNALRLDAGAKKAYRGKGIAAMETGDYESAIAYFNQALEKSGGKVSGDELDVLFYRAEAEQNMGDYEAAVNTYGILIDTSKEKAAAYAMRGSCYLKSGNEEKAREDFDAAVNADKNDYTLYISIYQALKESEREEDGKSYLNQALLISDKGTDAHKFRGMIQYLLGEYKNAETEFLAVKEADRETVRYLGMVYEALGEEEKAEEQYQKLLQDGIVDSSIYVSLGNHKLKLGNYETALNYFTQGIEALGEEASAELYFGQAVAYEYLGEYEEALTCFQTYVERFGENEEVNKEIEFLKTRN